MVWNTLPLPYEIASKAGSWRFVLEEKDDARIVTF